MIDMQQLSQIYAEATEMTVQEVFRQRDEITNAQFTDEMDKAQDLLSEYGIPLTHADMEYIEHRTYQDYVGTVDFDIKDSNHAKYDKYKTWMPYEQDYTHYPEVFKKYGDNYQGYEKMK